MAEERVFLNVDGVYVSNTRVVILGTTYATANITSVRKNTVPPNTGCATILTIVAALWAAGALTVLVVSEKVESVFGLFLAVVFLAAGILWSRSLKPVYHVMIASASGERQGLTSPDETLVDQATAAIADAITYRG
jgi:hypothetical protein